MPLLQWLRLLRINSFYADDRIVGDITRQVVDSGRSVLQIFQRGDEVEHVDFLLDRFNPHGVVLDVGCGVGAVSRLMALRRPDLEFILLNMSMSQLGMCPPFASVCASAEAIPLRDGSVDCVMACYVMGHLDIKVALAELRRVLKVGGILFIVDMTGGEMPLLQYTAHDWRGECPEMETTAFNAWMPNFREVYPNIRPVIVREVKQ